MRHALAATLLVAFATDARAQPMPTNNQYTTLYLKLLRSNNPPTFIGNTSLPDGTKIFVNIRGEQPGCLPKCLVADTLMGSPEVVVAGGHFIIGNEYTKGAPWSRDYPYIVTLNVFSVGQTKNVQSVIGSKGEKLRGDLVVSYDDNNKRIPIHFPRKDTPTEHERMSGLELFLETYVRIAPDGSSHIYFPGRSQ